MKHSALIVVIFTLTLLIAAFCSCDGAISVSVIDQTTRLQIYPNPDANDNYVLDPGTRYTLDVLFSGAELPGRGQRGNYTLQDLSYVSYADVAASDGLLTKDDVKHYGSIRFDPKGCSFTPGFLRSVRWPSGSNLLYQTRNYQDMTDANINHDTLANAFTTTTDNRYFNSAHAHDATISISADESVSNTNQFIMDTSTGAQVVVQVAPNASPSANGSLQLSCPFVVSGIQRPTRDLSSQNVPNVMDLLGAESSVVSDFSRSRYGPNWFDFDALSPQGKWVDQVCALHNNSQSAQLKPYIGTDVDGGSVVSYGDTGSAGFISRIGVKVKITSCDLPSPTTIIHSTEAQIALFATRQVAVTIPRPSLLVLNNNNNNNDDGEEEEVQNGSTLQANTTYRLNLRPPTGQGYKYEQCFNTYSVSTDVDTNGVLSSNAIDFFDYYDPLIDNVNESNGVADGFRLTSHDGKAILACTKFSPFDPSLSHGVLSRPINLRQNPMQIDIVIPENVTVVPNYVQIEPYFPTTNSSQQLAKSPVNVNSFQRFVIPQRQVPRLSITPFFAVTPFPSTAPRDGEIRRTNHFIVKQQFKYDLNLLPKNLFFSTSPAAYASLTTVSQGGFASGAGSYEQLFLSPKITNEAEISNFCSFPQTYKTLTNTTLPFKLIAMSRNVQLTVTDVAPTVETFFGIYWFGHKDTRIAEYSAFIADYNNVHGTAYTIETFEIEFSCKRFVLPTFGQQTCANLGAIAATNNGLTNPDLPHPQIDNVMFEYHPFGKTNADNDVVLTADYDFTTAPFTTEFNQNAFLFNMTQYAQYRNPIDVCHLTQRVGAKIRAARNAGQSYDVYTAGDFNTEELEAYNIAQTILMHNRENFHDQYTSGGKKYSLSFDERYLNPWGEANNNEFINSTAKPIEFQQKIDFWYGLQKDLKRWPTTEHQNKEQDARWNQNFMVLGADNIARALPHHVEITVYKKFDPLAPQGETDELIAPLEGTTISVSYDIARHLFFKQQHAAQCWYKKDSTNLVKTASRGWNLSPATGDASFVLPQAFTDQLFTAPYNGEEQIEDCRVVGQPEQWPFETMMDPRSWENQQNANFNVWQSVGEFIYNLSPHMEFSISWTKYGLVPPMHVSFIYENIGTCPVDENIFATLDDVKKCDPLINRVTTGTTTYAPLTRTETWSQRVTEPEKWSMKHASVLQDSTHLTLSSLYHAVPIEQDGAFANAPIDVINNVTLFSAQNDFYAALPSNARFEQYSYSAILGADIVLPPYPTITFDIDINQLQNSVFNTIDNVNVEENGIFIPFTLNLESPIIAANEEFGYTCHQSLFQQMYLSASTTPQLEASVEACNNNYRIVKLHPQTTIELKFTNPILHNVVSFDNAAWDIVFTIPEYTDANRGSWAVWDGYKWLLDKNNKAFGLDIEYNEETKILSLTNRNKVHSIVIDPSKWQIKGALTQTAAQQVNLWNIATTAYNNNTSLLIASLDLSFNYTLIQQNAEFIPEDQAWAAHTADAIWNYGLIETGIDIFYRNCEVGFPSHNNICPQASVEELTSDDSSSESSSSSEQASSK